ncbi:MAG: 5'/3'-nucleotidase SurE [Tissierellia bacterium]|nr:5'/3'-nucleotidase SurE [Tissierellia bacterium]
MNILLTNDDGVFAPGIKALAKELVKDHNVIIVAPEEEHSGQSHAITINRALIVRQVTLEGLDCPAYSVSGTPADCVRTAMDKILDWKPDVIFSGCNLGYNAGMDIIYSGTVSAAIEGNIFSIPSIAVSSKWVEGTARFDTAVQVAMDIFENAQHFLIRENGPAMVLNINSPYVDYDDLKGVKVATVGSPVYDYYFEEEVDGERTLRLEGRNRGENEEGTDRYYLERNYATVTPLIYDMNNEALIQDLKEYLHHD